MVQEGGRLAVGVSDRLAEGPIRGVILATPTVAASVGPQSQSVYKWSYPRCGKPKTEGRFIERGSTGTGETTCADPWSEERCPACGCSDQQQACTPLGIPEDAVGLGRLAGIGTDLEKPEGVLGSTLLLERRPVADETLEQGRHRIEASSGVLVPSPRTVPTGFIDTPYREDQWQSNDLSGSDVENLGSVLDHEFARNTIKNYRTQWRSFLVWAVRKGTRALPADPTHVAAYLAERIERHGHKPSTLRAAAAAIAFVHKATGLEDPCTGAAVKRTLRSATRKVGRLQRQAEALTAEVFATIQSTADHPRRGRGGLSESPRTARARGNLDIAVIGLMRDAMLRVSEAASLIWKDIQSEADGTGRLLIRRSKTDTEGEGAMAFVSAATMAMLRAIRGESLDTDRVFGLRPNQISARIKKAAQAAGLGSGFSGHSPRVGMARDLARAGIELPSLMVAGRWRTPTMPAHYIRNETAGRGAVAQFYRSGSRPPC